ncbi:hypothetical protein [Halobacillus litoralis]|uniref:hypothetical protein n=1 Tax=Halobacillus litoralis TaxID=45668 RepID=UPI001CD567DB|nr:hypothetical protein [Halobacillus litoralis]MCA1021607.1 hypothetical protein [Halobacillus litoralis]
MFTLVMKDKQPQTSYKVIHTDNFKVTEKCIFFECAGNNRVNKKDLLSFMVTMYHTTDKEHEAITNHFIGLDTDDLIKCTNGETVQFDYEMDEWTVNHDEIINGEDVKDILSDIFDQYEVKEETA